MRSRPATEHESHLTQLERGAVDRRLASVIAAALALAVGAGAAMTVLLAPEQLPPRLHRSRYEHPKGRARPSSAPSASAAPNAAGGPRDGEWSGGGRSGAREPSGARAESAALIRLPGTAPPAPAQPAPAAPAGPGARPRTGAATALRPTTTATMAQATTTTTATTAATTDDRSQPVRAAPACASSPPTSSCSCSRPWWEASRCARCCSRRAGERVDDALVQETEEFRRLARGRARPAHRPPVRRRRRGDLRRLPVAQRPGRARGLLHLRRRATPTAPSFAPGSGRCA